MSPSAQKVAVVAALACVVVLAISQRALLGGGAGDAPCGEGFSRRATRCCPSDEPPADLGAGLCSAHARSCPAPLVMTHRGCDSPERSVVHVPMTSVLIGPSDWEAEGRVRPRTVKAGPIDIDRFEVSVGHLRTREELAPRLADVDSARAASFVTLAQARAFCASRGGRLPTEDEWIVAAAGDKPRRYPWGDTGAVCRRAAWGLARGPCANGATGPDTVGAHPDGATPLGIQDLAGNVAEWVETGAPCEAHADCLGVVRGGSFDTDLATELRTWVRREVPASSADASIGFRCAYAALAP
jgi:formylglycine-generating enzyme required for sulfatase activity